MIRARARASAVLAALGLALLTAPGAAAGLEAQLERNPIRANETVRLVLSSDGRVNQSRPDLGPLGRDFDVLGMSTNTQVRFENGRQTATTRWIAELAPKRTGTLTIPALTLAGERSRPLTLEVLPASSGGVPGAAELFIEADVTPERPYVQSQVRYVVRLFRALDLLEGASLTEPEPEDAVVTRLGTDLAYTAERAGRRYRVLERRYAVFPQASGTLDIPPIAFVGEVVEPGQGGAFGGLFAQGRRVRLTTDPVTLEVRPRAGAARGEDWLPAAELTLEEDWPDAAAPTVGEPITRTIRIRANGLRGDQLPALELPVPEGMRSYADQPTTTTGSDQEWIRGVREQRVALIPERPGELTLPEIRIAWWDIERDAPAWASIPARTVAVAPAAIPASTAAAALGGDTGSSTKAGAAPTAGATDRGTGALAHPGPWQIASAALGLAWLLTLAAWYRARRRQAPVAAGATANAAGAPELADVRAARDAVASACAADDADAARHALLRWARAALGPPATTSLGALARRLGDPRLAAALAELDRSLYAAERGAWSGAALGALVDRLEAPSRSREPGSGAPLPPLYPSRT